MIFIGTREQLKARFRAEIIKELDERKPLSIKDLEYAFTANDGKKYYHFFDHHNLPLERMAVKKSILAWMALGMDIAEFDKLIDTGEAALYAGIKAPQANSHTFKADIGFVFKELKRRREMVVHAELLFQFIAVHYVREDELPDVFDNEIFMQKVEVFKKEVREKGSSFFLTKPELKLLYDLSNMSESEWTAYYHESLIKARALSDQLSQMKEALSIA